MSGATREAMPEAAEGEDLSRRTCAVTRATHSPEDLIRFVADPAGRIVPDVARRLPGRGVWLYCHREVVQQAVSAKAFAQSLRRKVTVGADLPQVVEAQLLRRAKEALSLANKAGLVIAGFAQIDAAIVKGEPRLLIHATEAAADGTDKLDRRFRAFCRETETTPIIVNELSGEHLSLAIGRPNVIHAALKGGGATQNFIREAGRLSRYRSGGSGRDAFAKRQNSPPDTSQDAGNA